MLNLFLPVWLDLDAIGVEEPGFLKQSKGFEIEEIKKSNEWGFLYGRYSKRNFEGFAGREDF